jgi:hypothetical protein
MHSENSIHASGTVPCSALARPWEWQARKYLAARGDLTDRRARFDDRPLTATFSTLDDRDQPFRRDGAYNTLK